ncbi:MAG: haloacid dehalogenase [Blastopirellula sp.]|nr:MAG: haloacid dehalogenase [Blastopirellula sp.]
MPEVKSTVLFDLYGTLIYLKENRRPYMRLCDSKPTRSRLRESLVVDANSATEFCHVLEIPIPEEIEEIEFDLQRDIASATTYDDTMSTLEYLKGKNIQLGLISNLASPYRQPCDTLGLNQFFDATVFSCDEGVAKPDPKIYQIALARLNADPSTTLMVGDSLRCDVEGPASYGIRSILLDRSAHASDSLTLRSLNDLKSVL